MSLPLFEPQHLGHDPVPLAHDYHLDLALSLISSVGKTYSSDFVLQAIETSNVQEILPSILAQHAYDISEHGGLFLNEEHIDTSITIVINVDDLSVNLYSDKQKETGRRQERTTLIQPLIEHARFAKQQLPADFVLLNMEDSLQEIYFQALAILKYMRANNKSVSQLTSRSSTCRCQVLESWHEKKKEKYSARSVHRCNSLLPKSCRRLHSRPRAPPSIIRGAKADQKCH